MIQYRGSGFVNHMLTKRSKTHNEGLTQFFYLAGGANPLINAL
ncbi:hypothetical protein Y888_10070 [Mixta calida B021323]|nr:hypothetical protein Y888_10070 [Mixta calida B021323]